MPNPSVRASSQSGTGAGTSLAHSVPIPTCLAGDDLWASFTLNGGHGAVTGPAGWTRVFPTTIADDGFMSLVIYRKAATATEVAGGSITVTVGTAVRGNAGAVSIADADTSALDGSASASGTGASTTGTSFSTTAANTLVLSILALDSGTEIATVPALMTEQWNPTRTVTGQANAGATAAKTDTTSTPWNWSWATSLAWKTWVGALVPAASTTTPVSSSLDLQWRSLGQASASLDLRWRSLARVTADTDLRWRSLIRVSADVSLQWRVAVRVSADVSLPWRVLGAVSTDVSLPWRTLSSLAPVSQVVDLQWRTYGQVVQPLDLRWRVRVRVSSDADLRWRVFGSVASGLDLRWRVSVAVARDLALLWTHYGRAAGDLNLLWSSIETNTPRTANVVVSLDAGRVAALLDGILVLGGDLGEPHFSVDMAGL